MKKPVTSLLGLACIASLLTASSAGAATVRPLDATSLVPTVYTESPAWSDSFVDSIGVDSSFARHKYSPLVTQWLKWSGIRHLRDSGPASQLMLGIYSDLGASGIKHSIGMPQGFDPAALTTLLAQFAPYVDYVEGANEMDNVKVPNWAQMRLDQQNLWNTVRGNPANSKVAVFGTSFANPLNGPQVGPLDPIENFAVLHNATCDWNPGTSIVFVSIAANTAKIRLSSATKPIITTETGYNDNPLRGCSLSDDTISRYTPRTSAERWLAGEPRSYFTFLTDDPADAVFGAKGLLFVDGTPKPQFYTMGNLIHLLSDKGTAPAPQTVSYAVTGTTPDMHHIMLARQDGSYDLMIWRELPEWDHYGHKAIVVPPAPVTVTIPTNTSWVNLFQTNAGYGLSRTQLPVASGGVTASFNVTGSISVLHIYGRGHSAMMRR